MPCQSAASGRKAKTQTARMSPSPGYFQKGIVLDRVIIVGAGMAGIASALSLARRGVQVCVLESARGPLQAASYAPGGYLGPAALHSFVQPLSAFERMRRRIACTNPAKSLRYRMGSGQSDFLSRCLAFCEPNSADLVQSRFAALIGYSRSVLQSVTDEYGLTDYRSRVLLHAWRAADDIEKNRPTPSYVFGEVRSNPLTLAQMRALDPAILETCGFAGALCGAPDDTINAAFLARQVVTLCKDLGVAFSCRTQAEGFIRNKNGRVIGVRTNTGSVQGDAVLLCAGLGSAQLLKSAARTLPMAPLTAVSITAELSESTDLSRISLIDEDCGILFTAMDQRIRACGLAFLGAVEDKEIEAEYRRLYDAGRSVYGSAADWNRARYWRGTALALPDALPALGVLPSLPGLYLNCAHGMTGAASAFGSAEIVSDLITGRAAAIDPLPYRPERFGSA